MLQVNVTMPCHNKAPEEHCEEAGENQGDRLDGSGRLMSHNGEATLKRFLRETWELDCITSQVLLLRTQETMFFPKPLPCIPEMKMIADLLTQESRVEATWKPDTRTGKSLLL